MAIGISPLVDYAFKMLLGNERHINLLIHFLNGMLVGQPRIVHARILNPAQLKQTADDKLSILDILAIDELGRHLLIEMQIHVLQLKHVPVTADDVYNAPDDQKWSWFLCNADTLSVEDIPRLFPDPEFVEAAKVLHMIAQTPEQLMLYNARLKAQRDESGRILQAKLEGEQAAQAKLEAIREKLEAAEAGIAAAEASIAAAEAAIVAAEAATAEAQARGIAIGELRGQITLLQRLLKQPVWTDTEFATCDEALLSRTLSELQDRLTSSAP